MKNIGVNKENDSSGRVNSFYKLVALGLANPKVKEPLIKLLLINSFKILFDE